MNFYIKDPKTGKESVTLSLLIYGFIIATSKLLVSGLDIPGVLKFGEFGGVEYSAALAALGSLYWARKRDTITKPHSEEKEVSK